MDDARLKCAILNVQTIAGRSYRGIALRGLVGDLFGLGSTAASGLCRRLGFDPDQPVGVKRRQPQREPSK